MELVQIKVGEYEFTAQKYGHKVTCFWASQRAYEAHYEVREVLKAMRAAFEAAIEQNVLRVSVELFEIIEAMSETGGYYVTEVHSIMDNTPGYAIKPNFVKCDRYRRKKNRGEYKKWWQFWK